MKKLFGLIIVFLILAGCCKNPAGPGSDPVVPINTPIVSNTPVAVVTGTATPNTTPIPTSTPTVTATPEFTFTPTATATATPIIHTVHYTIQIAAANFSNITMTGEYRDSMTGNWAPIHFQLDAAGFQTIFTYGIWENYYAGLKLNITPNTPNNPANMASVTVYTYIDDVRALAETSAFDAYGNISFNTGDILVH